MEERYADASEMLADLKKIRGGEEVAPLRRTPPWHRILRIASVVVISVAMIGGSYNFV